VLCVLCARLTIGIATMVARHSQATDLLRPNTATAKERRFSTPKRAAAMALGPERADIMPWLAYRPGRRRSKLRQVLVGRALGRAVTS